MIATAFDLTTMSGEDVRLASRSGDFAQPTSGAAPDIVQTNVAILPKALAFEFLVFCQRNPKPCPVIEVLEDGQTEAVLSAPGSDIRSDVPMYRVYQDGDLVDEPHDISDHWRDDLVTFLLGCSFTFEHALIRNGVHLPYYGTDKNVAMYKTSIQTAQRRAIRWSDGRDSSLGASRKSRQGSAGNITFPRRPRRAGTHRRPCGNRHLRSFETGFRRRMGTAVRR